MIKLRRLYLFLIIQFFVNSSTAQIAESIYRTKLFYVYDNALDTIHFTPFPLYANQIFPINTFSIKDSIQIDGIGSKEIVFYRNYQGITSEHGGTFDIDESTSISKYEIWNLDNKQLLFEITTSYKTEYSTFQAHATPSHKKGRESYSCNFAIDKVGTITISNSKATGKVYEMKWKIVKKKGKKEAIVENVPMLFDATPRTKNGVYRFVDGAYIHD